MGSDGFRAGLQELSNLGQKQSLTTGAYERRKADETSVLRIDQPLGMTGKITRDTSIWDSSEAMGVPMSLLQKRKSNLNTYRDSLVPFSYYSRLFKSNVLSKRHKNLYFSRKKFNLLRRLTIVSIILF